MNSLSSSAGRCAAIAALCILIYLCILTPYAHYLAHVENISWLEVPGVPWQVLLLPAIAMTLGVTTLIGEPSRVHWLLGSAVVVTIYVLCWLSS